VADTQTPKQTHIHTHRQIYSKWGTYIQTGRLSYIQTYIQTDIHTDRHTETYIPPYVQTQTT